jgi:hypothetical protein
LGVMQDVFTFRDHFSLSGGLPPRVYHLLSYGLDLCMSMCGLLEGQAGLGACVSQLLSWSV